MDNETLKSPEFSVAIPSEYVAVAKLFAAKNDVRFYLNGINLEVSPTLGNGYSEGRLIATDGHRLGIFKLQNIDAQLDADQRNIIIPNELLAIVKCNTEQVVIEVGPGPNQRSLTVRQGTVASSGMSIDGKYPDWTRVIPSKECSNQVAQFNAAYIADLDKAYRYLHGNKGALNPSMIVISHNGMGPALIDLACPDFAGAIMPLNMPTKQQGVVAPSWAFDWPLAIDVAELRREQAAAIAAADKETV